MPEFTPETPVPGLDTFETRGIATAPLPPEEVRRLGNRRRSRRHAAVSVAGAALVAGAVLPVAILNHDGGSRGHQPQFATGTPTPAPARTISYPGSGVSVTTPDQVDKLVGTSTAFKTFIAGQVRALVAEGAQCADAFHGVTVQKYSTAGYALGGVNACGGYQALWARYDGTWGEAQGTQDTWDCDALAYLHVPSSFAGDCAEESGIFGTPGTGMPEPGMTKAEAEAAGLTISGDAAAPPCTTTSYDAPALPGGDATSGLYSPTDGLVRVAMTSNMKTEEKIGLGTPRSAVVAAYPGGRANGPFWQVPRPGGTTFLIRIGADDRVSSFTWQLDKADCAGYMM